MQSITVVVKYDELPSPTTVNSKFYWCSDSQGTKWLPGMIGGTYYPAGIYYSNGVEWEYMDSPYQATQTAVDAGLISDQFISPLTLKNSAQWGTEKSATIAQVTQQDVKSIYVSSLIGNNTIGTGAPAAPFKTITAGMTVASSSGAMNVSGTFTEDVSCGNSMSGLIVDFCGSTVRGSIKHTGSCDNMTYRSAAVISTGNVWYTTGSGTFTSGSSSVLSMASGTYSGGRQGKPSIGDTVQYFNGTTWVTVGAVTAINISSNSATVLASATITVAANSKIVGTNNNAKHFPISGTVVGGLFQPTRTTDSNLLTVGTTLYLEGSVWMVTASGSNPSITKCKNGNSSGGTEAFGWAAYPIIDLPTTDSGGHSFEDITFQGWGQLFLVRGDMYSGMNFRHCTALTPNSIGYQTGTLSTGQIHEIRDCSGIAVSVTATQPWITDSQSLSELIGASAWSYKFSTPILEAQGALAQQSELDALASTPSNSAIGVWLLNFASPTLPEAWTSAGTALQAGSLLYNTGTKVYPLAAPASGISQLTVIVGSARQSWVLRNDGSKLYRAAGLEAALDSFNASESPTQVSSSSTVVKAFGQLQSQINQKTEGARAVISNINVSGNIGTATNTVDKYSWLEWRQTNTNVVGQLPSPTDTATPRMVRVFYPISWTVGGTTTTANASGVYIGSSLILPGQATDFVWSGASWLPYQANQIQVGPQASSASLVKVSSTMDTGTALASLQNQLLIAANPAMCYWDGKSDPSIAGNSFPQAALAGNATWVGGTNLLRLTENVNGQFGTIVWDFPHVPFLHARFSYKAGGGNGADAMYFFCFCDAIPTDERGSGTTKGYIIAISEYHAAIGAFWGFTGGWLNDNGGTWQVNSGGLASSSQSNLADNTVQNIDVVITKNRVRVYRNQSVSLVDSGGASPVIDFYDVQTRDLSGTKMGFGARTGGLNNFHYLGNCLVTRNMTTALFGLG